MEFASSACRRFVTVVRTILIMSALWGLATALTVSAQPAPPPFTPAGPAQTERPAVTPAGRDDWERALARTPLKKGCFTASYPSVDWQEVPCASPPSHPFNVGGSAQSDWTATNSNTTRPLTGARGSFDNVTGLNKITGKVGNNPVADDIFSLQINTNYFNSPLCLSAPAAVPPCYGWQQFIFSNHYASGVLMEYFLYNYTGPCPSGWIPYSVSNGCTAFSSVMPVNKQTAANLWLLRLWAQTDGVYDRVMITSCPTAATCEVHQTGYDSVLGLAPGWQGAEFNVFGDGGSSPVATFNDKSTLVVRVELDEGWKPEPSCTRQSFTSESNNLDLVAPPNVNLSTQWPALVFTETNDPNITKIPSCAFTAGEPHLSTFDGQLYDFQALGDFLLVEAAPDFVVQTRQQRVNWPIPNVTANKAVATKMGGTRVAVCLGPTRLEVEGAQVDLADGRSLSLPNGVSVSRSGRCTSSRARTAKRCALRYPRTTFSMSTWTLETFPESGCAVFLATPTEEPTTISPHVTEGCFRSRFLSPIFMALTQIAGAFHQTSRCSAGTTML
jgi:hypothetical protein